jgi:hypothetical protein
MVAKGNPKSREVRVAARFKVGQRVRARYIQPTGHTRLPRYARGKLGTIHLDHGIYVFPDTNADSLGEKPQHRRGSRAGREAARAVPLYYFARDAAPGDTKADVVKEIWLLEENS